MNKGDYSVVNLCFLEYFEDRGKEALNILKSAKINNYLGEILKAIVELDKHMYILQDDKMTSEKVEESLKQSLSLKPQNSLALICQIEFYKKQKNFGLM